MILITISILRFSKTDPIPIKTFFKTDSEPESNSQRQTIPIPIPNTGCELLSMPLSFAFFASSNHSTSPNTQNVFPTQKNMWVLRLILSRRVKYYPCLKQQTPERGRNLSIFTITSNFFSASHTYCRLPSLSIRHESSSTTRISNVWPESCKNGWSPTVQCCLSTRMLTRSTNLRVVKSFYGSRSLRRSFMRPHSRGSTWTMAEERGKLKLFSYQIVFCYSLFSIKYSLMPIA